MDVAATEIGRAANSSAATLYIQAVDAKGKPVNGKRRHAVTVVRSMSPSERLRLLHQRHGVSTASRYDTKRRSA